MSKPGMGASSFAATPDPVEAADPFTDWLSGVPMRRPERTEHVYLRGDLVADYEALDAELHALLAAEPSTDDRLVNTAAVRRRELATQMAQIRAELEASRRAIRFRSLDRDAARAFSKQAEAEAEETSRDVNDIVAELWIAAAAVSPRMTRERVQQLRAGVGEGQFSALWDAAFGVTNDRTVTVPLSLASSAILASGGSSTS